MLLSLRLPMEAAVLVSLVLHSRTGVRLSLFILGHHIQLVILVLQSRTTALHLWNQIHAQMILWLS